MIEDYKTAKRMGDEAVRSAKRSGKSPYLPVLDALIDVSNTAGQVSLGLLELPLSRIKGNKEKSRNNAFANNFMPIFDANTEFALKWSALYDSYMEEGIRDAIKVYEYMNEYYVQEGNKRVSVSKLGGNEYILADVTRIIPKKDGSKEVQVYYEYLDFYNLTNNFLLVFSEPGAYEKLADLLGQNLVDPWPEEVCSELKSAYYRFERVLKKEVKYFVDQNASNAFLIYISIFPIKTISESTDEQIKNNIILARDEMIASGKTDDTTFLDEAPGEGENDDKSAGIMRIFSRTKKYTASSPLRVGFIYDADIEQSRWVDSHEAGRLYVDEMTGENVLTAAYYVDQLGGTQSALEAAVKDKNEIIFAVSPSMSDDVLKTAVKNPDIKFLNCSVGQAFSSLRCYHAKFYEATFLMGVLAANRALLEGDASQIDYVVRKVNQMSRIDLNAFAIGVSTMAPDCKVVLKPVGESGEANVESKVYADIEYSTVGRTGRRPGIYVSNAEKDVYVGAPYFNWGRYYVHIVQSVLSGTWDLGGRLDDTTPANYWFGISTGVVDILAPKLPYQTAKMLSFFKNSIVNGDYTPFVGEIRSNDDKVIQSSFPGSNSSRRTLELSKENLDPKDIVSMTWMNENIVGEL
ncbi:MAG: BMP family ABC transporter substrate-binding protein [Eubacterium sp.]|nr:BMP family ABC transporter substrate-binding protein [Eubacterium sp.]